MKPYLLHGLFESRAADCPDNAAVVCAGQTVSYAELDERSNRLANAFRARDIGRGDRVGIYFEKSPEAVTAVFAALKCGAAYVPIDPKAPARRAGTIIDNCRMRGLITSAEKLGQLSGVLSALPGTVVTVDDAPAGALAWNDALRAGSGPVPDPGLIEQDLAYILYTSGSTGEPKGVMISHRAALSFVQWAVDYFALRADDRLSNHAPLHFDLSTFDLFGALAVGASVSLVPAATGIFPRNLADWIETERISVWYSVPSALTQLALKGGLDRHAYERLRLVLFAGEVFPAPHLRRLMELWPRAHYFNLYGPTETNVCTVFPVDKPPEAGTLPIGRSCANSEVFALTDGMRVAAVDEIGELHVRGPALMSGYWGRPELSEKALIRNPLLPDRNEFVYRTGDLVRRDAAGDCHFIGRRDLQVKSRGYRIELGDVEAVLYRHAGVAEAAVISDPHEEFGCTLRAVIAARPDAQLDRAQMAAFCGEHLPPYMVPAEFEFRDGLPKTPNGKVDRAALDSIAKS